MACSICKKKYPKEPLFNLCGHIVCKHCDVGCKCSACQLGIDRSTILPNESNIFSNLPNTSGSSRVTRRGKCNKKTFDSEDRQNKKKHLYNQNICMKSTAGFKKAAQIDSEEARGGLKHCCNPVGSCPRFPASCTEVGNSLVTNPQPTQDNLPSRSQTSDKQEKNMPKNRVQVGTKGRASSQLINKHTNVSGMNGNLNDHILFKNSSNINQQILFSTVTVVEDVNSIVERYIGFDIKNIKSEEGTFNDMPKLERQDLYEPNESLVNLSEGERDMCDLEKESDLYTNRLNFPEIKVEKNDLDDQTGFISNTIIEVYDSCEDEEPVNNNFDDNQIGHFIISEGSEVQNSAQEEKHLANITLLKTSENCYKVKKEKSPDIPSTSDTDTLNQNETHFYPSIIRSEQVVPMKVDNNETVSESEEYGTISETSFDNKRSQKSKVYSKKRKKRTHTKEVSLNTSNYNVGINKLSAEWNVQLYQDESSTSDSDVTSGKRHCSFSPRLTYPDSSKKLAMATCASETSNNLGICLKTPEQEGSMMSEGTRALDEPGQLDFRGFKDDEIFPLSVKEMLFKMNTTSSSQFSFTLNGKEILLRKKALSPVTSMERAVANASAQLEDSVVDLGTAASSTPHQPSAASLGITSRRQLFFHTPLITKAHEFHKAGESSGDSDSEEDTMLWDSRRSRQTHSSTQTSPTLNQKVFSPDDSDEPSTLQALDSLDKLLDKVEDNWKLEQNRNLSFAACGVTSSESMLIMKLAQLSNSSLCRDFSHETTHLIVGEAGIGSRDYLLAIAYRAYIVTVDWVNLCLAQNTIIPPTGFIPTLEEGPQRCIEPVSPPFEGFYIFFKMCSFVPNYSLYELTKTLCSISGAKIIMDHEKCYQFLHQKAFPRFFIFEDQSQLTQPVLDKCEALRVVALSSGWVWASIRAYRPVPILAYLGSPLSLAQLAQDYSVPPQLLSRPQPVQS